MYFLMITKINQIRRFVFFGFAERSNSWKSTRTLSSFRLGYLYRFRSSKIVTSQRNLRSCSALWQYPIRITLSDFRQLDLKSGIAPMNGMNLNKGVFESNELLYARAASPAADGIIARGIIRVSAAAAASSITLSARCHQTSLVVCARELRGHRVFGFTVLIRSRPISSYSDGGRKKPRDWTLELHGPKSRLELLRL